jgi:hypothetical protein
MIRSAIATMNELRIWTSDLGAKVRACRKGLAARDRPQLMLSDVQDGFGPESQLLLALDH